MILVGKIVFLMLAMMYLVPVVIGGFRGDTVYAWQTFLLSTGVVGFVTLHWLI